MNKKISIVLAGIALLNIIIFFIIFHKNGYFNLIIPTSISVMLLAVSLIVKEIEF